MDCLCTNGYPLTASAITHGLLQVTHGLHQLQKQPIGDQLQCSSILNLGFLMNVLESMLTPVRVGIYSWQLGHLAQLHPFGPVAQLDGSWRLWSRAAG